MRPSDPVAEAYGAIRPRAAVKSGCVYRRAQLPGGPLLRIFRRLSAANLVSTEKLIEGKCLVLHVRSVSPLSSAAQSGLCCCFTFFWRMKSLAPRCGFPDIE